MWWTIKGYIVYQKKILPDTCEKCFGINHGGKLDKGSGLYNVTFVTMPLVSTSEPYEPLY
jgi:hypothetical protein